MSTDIDTVQYIVQPGSSATLSARKPTKDNENMIWDSQEIVWWGRTTYLKTYVG